MRHATEEPRRSEDAAKEVQVTGWACSRCGHFWGIDERMARYCCSDTFPCECGKARYQKGHVRCKDCETQQRADSLAKSVSEAGEVAGYSGWIYWEPMELHNNGYFRDANDLIEACELDGVPVPEFAFCCDEERFSLDLGWAIENECEEHHEDMYDQLSGEKELQAAVDAFNEQNKDQMTFHPDYRRKVRIRPADTKGSD